jgi:hypothetical protein
MNAFRASPPSLLDALHADHPAPDRADGLGLYSFLIGRWDMDFVAHGEAGQTQTGQGEIHAGWVLEGRALQDVWIIPRRATRRPDLPPGPNFYGTTLRVYDPTIDAWHILWSDPVMNYYTRQIGRAQGNDIVQLGKDDSGASVRWRFTERTADAFHWLGERSPDDGTSWRLLIEFFARRAAPEAVR